jgi:hypothetical protein
MKTLREVLPGLGDADKAWIKIWRKKYGLTAEEVRQKLRQKTNEDIDPASIEEYWKNEHITPTQPVTESLTGEQARPTTSGQFSGAMERDIELALLNQLDSLGLTLFVDEQGRDGQQYPAGEFGRIDLLTTHTNGDFVVIELKREEPPRDTIGQIAGYIAFVKKNVQKAKGHKVIGWIMARPSSQADDQILEEAAEAVGIQVKWYVVRIEVIGGHVSHE